MGVFHKFFSKKPLLLVATLILISGCFSKHSPFPINSFVKIENYAKKTFESENIVISSLMRVGTGSGSIIHHKGKKSYILTAKHVCDVDSVVERKLIDIDGDEYISVVFALSENHDLCILEIERTNKPPLKLALFPPKKGDKVFNIAAPGGIFEKDMVPCYEGYYAGRSTMLKADVYTVPSFPGSSGSPIVNKHGELIGMIYASNIRFHHVTLSVTHKQLSTFINAHLGEVENFKY